MRERHHKLLRYKRFRKAKDNAVKGDKQDEALAEDVPVRSKYISAQAGEGKKKRGSPNKKATKIKFGDRAEYGRCRMWSDWCVTEVMQ